MRLRIISLIAIGLLPATLVTGTGSEFRSSPTAKRFIRERTPAI